MLKIKKENCKSCGYCVASCKQGALSISDELNQKGYNIISVDLDKCIDCGICHTVCPDYVITLEEVAVS